MFAVPLSRAIRELYFDDFRPLDGPKFRPDLIDNSQTPTYLNIHHINWSKDLYGHKFISFYLNIDPEEYPLIIQNLAMICSIPYICYFWFWSINFYINDYRPGSSIVSFHTNLFTMQIIPTVFALFLAGATLVFYRIDRNMAYVFFKDPENRKAVEIWRDYKTSHGIITCTIIPEFFYKRTGYISVFIDKVVPKKWLVQSNIITVLTTASVAPSINDGPNLIDNGKISAYASSITCKHTTQSVTESNHEKYLRTGYMNAYPKSVASSSQLPGSVASSSINYNNQSTSSSNKSFDVSSEKSSRSSVSKTSEFSKSSALSQYAESTASSSAPASKGFGFMPSFFNSSVPSTSETKSTRSEISSKYPESAYSSSSSRHLLSSLNIFGKYAESSYSAASESSSKYSKSTRSSASSKYPDSVSSSTSSKYSKSSYSSSSSKSQESIHSSSSSKYPKSSRSSLSYFQNSLVSSKSSPQYPDSARTSVSESPSKYEKSKDSSSSKKPSDLSQSSVKSFQNSKTPSTYSSASGSSHSTISSPSSRYPAPAPAPAPALAPSTSSHQFYATSTTSSSRYPGSLNSSTSSFRSSGSSNHLRYMSSDSFSMRSSESQSSEYSTRSNSSTTSTITPNNHSLSSNFDSQSITSSATSDSTASSLHAQFLGSSVIPGYKDAKDKKGKNRCKDQRK
ncbi:uncharacterized protein SAPINGB_P002830 [Magnusiomyces paraingens]|uniref:Uncharacterized protein n=1 Tax=Magnusiomyces paraingens TaxID=2606893 RepID=A0A5E8BJ32_9ASCO|nr:uncharacterized protein SAPINGB_P002830 [Saprochaete ingens]VVT50637.1 unnamed protein product [Saprochaete ingens]